MRTPHIQVKHIFDELYKYTFADTDEFKAKEGCRNKSIVSFGQRTPLDVPHCRERITPGQSNATRKFVECKFRGQVSIHFGQQVHHSDFELTFHMLNMLNSYPHLNFVEKNDLTVSKRRKTNSSSNSLTSVL